jgi:transcriptional regulator with XRE-family HTH domain
MDDSTKRALSYAATIKKYRKLQNMSQEDLSESSGINVNDFYDNEIKTTGELLSALISLEKQTNMVIKGTKTKDGHYDPKTISISFKDNDINTLLANYLECKDSDMDSDENTDSSKESIELLILSDTPIKKTSTVGMIYSWF